MTLWFTGLSGRGKTTLANWVEREIKKRGIPVVHLDGDEVRKGLCRDLGFSEEDRHENNRRVAEVAKILNSAGILVLAHQGEISDFNGIGFRYEPPTSPDLVVRTDQLSLDEAGAKVIQFLSQI